MKPLKRLKRRRVQRMPGASPGSLVYRGVHEETPMFIEVISYREEEIIEQDYSTIEDAIAAIRPDTMNWLNVIGLHNMDTIRAIGNHFKLHPLLLEDVVNPTQRSKVEYYENDVAFVVARMLQEEEAQILTEQVSFVLVGNTLISFQEVVGDVFEPVRERLRTPKLRIRRTGPDYLLYALLDAIVDNYFPMLDGQEVELESIEDSVVLSSANVLGEIHRVRRNVIAIWRGILPMREVAMRLERGDSHVFKEETLLFLRDLNDHVVLAVEQADALRDLTSNLQDLQMSASGQRMNEIMKVLTLIATIFIPLTFVAGIYGMNFTHMPELEMPHGYFFALGAMAVLAVLMVIWFRRRKWL